MFGLRVVKHFRRVFLLLTIIVISLPYGRFLIGNLPIYFSSALIIGLFTINTITHYNIKTDNAKIILGFLSGYIILVTTLHTIILGTNFIIYNNFNRVLSLSVLYLLFVWLLIDNNCRDKLVQYLFIGLKIHILLIIFQFACSLIGGDLLEYYYLVVYKYISNSDQFYNEINKVKADWYFLRYSGGYHNPNSAGVSLILGFIILKLTGYRINYIWTCLLFFSLILTSSKQAFLLFIIFSGAFNYKHFLFFLISGVLLIYVISLLGWETSEYGSRLFFIDNYLNSSDERSWGYENFLNFIQTNLPGFLFGTGINSLGLRLQQGVTIDIKNVGFVSNSFFLVVSYIGFFGLMLLVYVFYKLYKWAGDKSKLLFFYSIVIFISFFDNHIAIMESLQLLIFMGIFLVGNYSSSIQSSQHNIGII